MQRHHLLKSGRHQAGLLISQVLAEEITSRYALNHWPQATLWDPTLQAAYQALWHFEADESAQQQEMYYMDAQLALLKNMASYLEQGISFPDYIHRAYSNAHFVKVVEWQPLPWLLFLIHQFLSRLPLTIFRLRHQKKIPLDLSSGIFFDR